MFLTNGAIAVNFCIVKNENTVYLTRNIPYFCKTVLLYVWLTRSVFL